MQVLHCLRPLSDGARYRFAVASRALAAMVGGYVLASLITACLAHVLPGSRADATQMAMVLSFLFYLLAVIWVFSARSAGRAWLGLLLASLLPALALLYLLWPVVGSWV